jgi:hypothetical protein
MLQSEMREAQDKVIELDSPPRVIELFVTALYQSSITPYLLPGDGLECLFMLCQFYDRYGIDSLVLEDLVIANLYPDNIMQAIENWTRFPNHNQRLLNKILSKLRQYLTYNKQLTFLTEYGEQWLPANPLTTSACVSIFTSLIEKRDAMTRRPILLSSLGARKRKLEEFITTLLYDCLSTDSIPSFSRRHTYKRPGFEDGTLTWKLIDRSIDDWTHRHSQFDSPATRAYIKERVRWGLQDLESLNYQFSTVEEFLSGPRDSILRRLDHLSLPLVNIDRLWDLNLDMSALKFLFESIGSFTPYVEQHFSGAADEITMSFSSGKGEAETALATS